MREPKTQERYRVALERILKAFSQQGPTAVFTMANIARDALGVTAEPSTEAK